MPIVLDGRFYERHSDHTGEILIPPEIDENSPLFLPGLLVPDIRVHDEVMDHDNNPRFYVLRSEYLGDQDLYINAKILLRREADARYIGVIESIPEREGTRPRVRLTVSSKDNEPLFLENKQKLDEMLSSSSTFWWDMK